MYKKFTLTIFLIIILSNFSKAYSIEADVFVQSTVNRAAKTLGGNLSKEERVEKLKDIARDTTHLELIERTQLKSKLINTKQHFLNIF